MWNDEETPSTQPTEFVAKLYGMLENPSYKGIVSWSDTQDSFLILDMAKFQGQIIPKEFNHSNFSSFVRQLNKYDFHKQRFGSSKIWEFKHKDFVPANKTRAHVIKRKGPSTRNNAALQEQIEDLNGQLLDVYARMDKLESDNARLLGMIEQQQNYIAMVGQVKAPITPASVPHPVQPVPQAALASQAHPQALAPQTAPHTVAARILVAMSAGDIRNAISKIVSDVGYFVDCTESGLEAIDMVKASKYCALIVEPILSQVSGTEAAEQIRANLGSQFPIILTDGVEGGDLQAKDAYYRDKGVDTVLWRPFTKSQLIDILHNYIN